MSRSGTVYEEVDNESFLDDDELQFKRALELGGTRGLGSRVDGDIEDLFSDDDNDYDNDDDNDSDDDNDDGINFNVKDLDRL